LLDWLIGSAHAAPIRPELLEQLDGWVPRRREIDDYLRTVEELLDAVAKAERGRGKLPPAHLALYGALLRPPGRRPAGANTSSVTERSKPSARQPGRWA
jgi:hypothetical protein